MEMDWDVAAKIITSVFTTALAILAKRAFDERPRLVSYISHAAAVNIPNNTDIPATQTAPEVASATGDARNPVTTEPTSQTSSSAAPQITVNTHGLIVRNVGKRTAKNVRISHNAPLVPHQVYPNVKYDINLVPSGGWEILIPTIVPNEQIQIAYLYSPPVTVQNFHSSTKSDEGLAQILNVLPTPQPPRWAKGIAYLFFYIGIFATTSALVSAMQWLYTARSLFRAITPS